MARLSFFLLLVHFSLASGFAGAAQSPSGSGREALRRQEQIILQQEDRLRRQQRDFFEGDGRAAPSRRVDTLPHVQEEAGAPCMQVSEVVFSGASLVPARRLDELAAPYRGRCLGVAEITNLLRDVTNEYIARGYVTSRAFVDSAEQRPGSLRVLVVEGTVEKIILNNGDPDSYFRGRTAFPFLEGRPLNLRDLEQGLDQLNRLPSADATLELAPGETLGGTIVKVSNKVSRSWRLNLGFDNLGQKNTGRGAYTLALEKDNFMGIGDQFGLYWSAAFPFWDEEVRNHERRGNNESLSAFCSLPFGYWTFSGSLSRYRYSTPIYGMNAIYRSKGETSLFNVRAERVVHRDAESKTSFFLGLLHRNVDNYIEGYRLEASSYNMSALQAGVAHTRRFLGGSLGARLEYTRGVMAFGTTKQQNYSHFTPQDEFDKYSAHLSYYRPFQVAELPLFWSLSAYGQMTPQTLFGAERIQIGGPSSVRGFLHDSLSGEQGFFLRNEAGFSPPWFEGLKERGPVSGLQFYAAYDFGMLHPERRDRYERGRMQGAALGLRTSGPLSLDICVAKALDHPSFVKTRDIEFYLSATYTF